MSTVANRGHRLELAAPTLSIVIPTYQERDNLEPLISRLDAALAGIAWEVIFVDDDSPDGTASAARRLAQNDPRIRCLRRLGRRGLAGACIEGVLSSSADIVAIMDADMQHDERILPGMLACILNGAELAIGSRLVAGGSAADGFTRFRAAISAAAIRCARFVLGTSVNDVMSGFFMMRRELAETIAPELATSGFKILADILAHVPRPSRIEEIPYQFKPRRAGRSKLDARVGADFIALMINKATKGLVPLRFVSFALVGGVGLVLHIAVLKVLLLRTQLSFSADQSIATLVAMSSNFLFNNALTYRDARLSGWHLVLGLLLFYLVCSAGALANIAFAGWLFLRGMPWWAAGSVGVAAGSIWNFALSSTYVWPILRRST